jgi:membrane protease YdiL (CAAX protease family)
MMKAKNPTLGAIMHRKQLTVLLIMLIVYAFSAFAVYAFFTGELAAMAGVPMPDMGVSNAVLGLANAGVVLVVYGIVGMIGFWFARKLELPGIFSADGNWRRWFTSPLLLGLSCGVFVVVLDVVFAPINGYGRIEHPSFPSSIFASIGAGIGEEILFRGFFFGLWGLLLNWLFKRFNRRALVLWIANVIAALAFAASHMGTLLLLTGASSPAELSPVLLAEVFLLNGVIGLVAGDRYMKDGLVAAAGVHFWADVVFHVIWGLV